MASSFTFADACRDENLFGNWFAAESWAAWRVIHKAAFGNALTADEIAVFHGLAGDRPPPDRPVRELWIVAGRRAGKDVNAAAMAAWASTFGAAQTGVLRQLQRGEKAVVQLLAVDRAQAKVALSYVRGYFERPILRKEVAREAPDGLELKNGVGVEVTTSDLRSVRGRTVICAILDEVAFWRSEGSLNPDVEILRAIRPAMATVPSAMLIGISSPYARKGVLWERYKRYFGKAGDILVIQAPTWVLNPTLPRDGDFISQEYADDPLSAAAEYGANFRSDIETFVTREAVEGCVDIGVIERMPQRIGYRAFVDPSGGSADSFTLAIGHQDGERAVLDAMREVKPPFSPAEAVSELAALLKKYRIYTVAGDRYAGEWPREAFQNHGITYEVADRSRSEIYQDFLPLLNSRRALLLDHDVLVNQIAGLERRQTRGGRSIIDHGPNGHDDIANAVAGVLTTIIGKRTTCLYTKENIGI